MKEKFRKYFENMPFLFYLAAIMNPRIKIDNLKLLLSNFILCLNYEQDVDKLLLDRALLEKMYSLYRDELFPRLLLRLEHQHHHKLFLLA